MKSLIVLLLALTLAFVSSAQEYLISVKQIPGSSAYECEIQPNVANNTPEFSDNDLITWIFPDGQFSQWEIETDTPFTNKVINNSNKITWTPYMTSTSGPDSIIAYVARKGKPGNPGINAVTDTSPVITVPGLPAAFAMPDTATWQINQAWEFSLSRETILIVSYKLPIMCTDGELMLTYDSTQMDTVTNEIFVYQNETISTTLEGTAEKTIAISNLQNNGKNINHVYVKFRVSNSVLEGTKIDLVFQGKNSCYRTRDTLHYLVKGYPHDPNEKTANHPQVKYKPKPNPRDLTYHIKFHNDGNKPVQLVDVEDRIPPLLVSATLMKGTIPNEQTTLKNWNIIDSTLKVEFENLNLPGLKQLNPHYAYDQTNYSFDFHICSVSDLPPLGSIINSANIYFYDEDGLRLPPVLTNESKVSIFNDGGYEGATNCPSVSSVLRPGLFSEIDILPNPFHASITIFFKLENKTRLNVEVKDLSGRVVDKIIDREYLAGDHQIEWNNTGVPSGLYFLDIFAGYGRITRKLIKI